MKKILVLILLLAASALYAQTISPVVVECGKKCTGEFSVTNNGVNPFTVTVQPFLFSLNPKDGHSIFRQLDDTVDVQLDEMSARVGPKVTYTFGYRMKCAQYPCMVTMLASMVVGHTTDGVAVRVSLPHVIYQCQSSKDCRKNARLAAGLKD